MEPPTGGTLTELLSRAADAAHIHESSSFHPSAGNASMMTRIVLTLFILPLAAATYAPALCAAQSGGEKTIVLEKNEGEKRIRRPRSSLPIPTNEFILKVTPQNGSKHLVLGTEDIPPGGMIPKHRHLGQDEILLVQTGTAHVTLNDKEYDVHAGGTVFFPARTWVSLKNIGQDSISLVFIFSAPGFEQNMRCGSVLAGQSGPPISVDELKLCAHKGHVEYQALAAPSRK